MAELRTGYPKDTSLYIDVRRVVDKEQFEMILYKPGMAMEYIGDALRQNNMLMLNPEDYSNITIRFNHLPRKTPIRALRADDVGQFVTVEGLVRRLTEVRPKIQIASYRCRHCGRYLRESQPIDATRIVPPRECPHCHKTVARNFELQQRGHTFVDSQAITIQESHESLEGGQSPVSIEATLYEDITGKINAGNKIIINGVLKTVQSGRNEPVWEKYVEVSSIEFPETDYLDVKFNNEDFERIGALAKDERIYEKLVASICPTIFGNETVKLAVALQLFGGITKQIGTARLRGDIHILLVGDPALAKSKILESAVKLSSRGVLASGKGASTAGLTATAVRDDSKFGSGRWTLEAGALVLADNGLCAVDELDKMSDSDRSSLHHALESQSIPIAKAGITTTLMSRCSLLAAANPKSGRFDDYKPLSEQFDLEPPLLSRFDLIFVLVDSPVRDRDERIAAHIVRTQKLGQRVKSNTIEEGEVEASRLVPMIPQDLLRKYIAYARKTCFPVLSDDAIDILKNFYLDMRSQRKTDAVPVSVRQLEALIRLAEASAKVRLSEVIEKSDAELVVALVEECLRQVAYDKTTGQFDIDKMCGRTTQSQRNRVTVVTQIIRELTDPVTGVASYPAVIGEAMARNFSDAEIQDTLDVMRKNTLIIEPLQHRTVKLL